MNVAEWEISENGLKYDREWTIIDDYGKGLKLNQEPKLSSIFPKIQNDKLVITSHGFDPLEIDLKEFPNKKNDLMICGMKMNGLMYGSSVNEWLQKVLNRKCFLIRKDPEVDRFSKSNKINFSNEAQFLMINESSMKDLNEKIPNSNILTIDWLIERFRPNLVIKGDTIPYEEDLYENLQIGDLKFNVTGKCNRCTMICVDSKSLKQTNEPLRTLLTYRRDSGRILFGILLNTDTFGIIQVGNEMRIL
jgi:molybdenum cofactor sulfurtransferase